jgi:hypothetical protein
MSRAQFKKQLQLGLNTVFGLEYKRYPEQWREIFDVFTSKKAYEEDVLLAGMGAAPVKAEGAAVAYDSGSEAWTARYLHETIALAFSITEEAVEDGLYGDLGAKFVKALARSMAHTKEIKGAAVLNNGFNAAFPIGDGQPLFSTLHPLTGGGTFANTFATMADLSEASLEDALTSIGNFVDDRGIPVAYMGMKLIVPQGGQYTAQRILFSELRSGTADNDANAMKQMGLFPQGWCVNQRLVDPDGFFIKTDCQDGLKMFQRTPLKRGMEGDFESGNLRFKTRERYSFGISDPRGCFGSSGGI